MVSGTDDELINEAVPVSGGIDVAELTVVAVSVADDDASVAPGNERGLGVMDEDGEFAVGVNENAEAVEDDDGSAGEDEETVGDIEAVAGSAVNDTADDVGDADEVLATSDEAWRTNRRRGSSESTKLPVPDPTDDPPPPELLDAASLAAPPEADELAVPVLEATGTADDAEAMVGAGVTRGSTLETVISSESVASYSFPSR